MEILAPCVLTKNEEQDLPKCLEALFEQFSQVFIVDSGSTDKTLEIASKFGCNILTNIQTESFDAAKQRNFALSKLKHIAKYILFVDADEIIIPKTRNVIESNIKIHGDKIESYSIPLLYYLHGKKIKSFGYPNWHERVIRNDIGFKSAFGEYTDAKSRLNISEIYFKHNFNSKGMEKFMLKHIRYALFLGLQLAEDNKKDLEYFKKPGIRQKVKYLVRNLGLARPFGRFLFHYLLRLGFLEGRSGLILACYMFVFEFMAVVHSIELKRVEINEDL